MVWHTDRAGDSRSVALQSGMNSLPDLAVGLILQRSFAGMGSGLLPWLRLSLVCRCASRDTGREGTQPSALLWPCLLEQEISRA